MPDVTALAELVDAVAVEAVTRLGRCNATTWAQDRAPNLGRKTMTGDEARTILEAAGTDDEDVAAALLAAHRFPGTWAYTKNRHAACVYRMPARDWDVQDTAESEDRIKRLRRGGRS